MPELNVRARGRDKKIALGARALNAIDAWIAQNSLEPASGRDTAAMAIS
jgi:hypothetical protein